MVIALVGACGKLGRATFDILKNFYDVARVDPNGGDVDCLQGLPFDVDIVVDVSCAEQSAKSVEYALRRNVPIVIACTGHSDEQLDFIRASSHQIPVFLAYNMAYGVQVFKQTAEFLASNFEGEIHLHEEHHKHKKDCPSGTAKEVAALLENMGRKVDISSARGGDVIGKHSLCFYGEGEMIELTHTALSRDAFASGIKKAVDFLIDKDSGFYCMSDLTAINIEK